MKSLTLAVTALAVALTLAPARASSITTNLYYSTQVQEDIAYSCKDISISNSTGIVAATCNHYRSRTSDEVDLYDSTLDLDDVI